MARLIFEPFVQPWWLMLWAAAALALSVYHYRWQLAGLLRPRLRWLLLWLEWAAIAMFVAYAANVQLERSHPDPGACRIAVLVDGSESMHSCNDMPDGRSRWQAAVAAVEIFHSRNGGQCEVRQFGGSAFPAVPWPLDDADASPPLPGEDPLLGLPAAPAPPPPPGPKRCSDTPPSCPKLNSPPDLALPTALASADADVAPPPEPPSPACFVFR